MRNIFAVLFSLVAVCAAGTSSTTNATTYTYQPCAGSSKSMPYSECNAWQDIMEAWGKGTELSVCSPVDPCACNSSVLKVQCIDDHVDTVNVASFDAKGPLLPAFAAFTEMTSFGIGWGGPQSSMPDEWGQLTNLKYFGISGAVNGNFPTWISDMINLEQLAVNYIPELTGDIPPLDKLTNMKYLFIRSLPKLNRGPLPDASSAKGLMTYYLSDTNRVGQLPQWLGPHFAAQNETQQHVSQIHVENNDLSGCIPQNLASYGSSGGFPDIGLSGNKFTGLIPITSFRTGQPTRCHLAGNNFTCPFPDWALDPDYNCGVTDADCTSCGAGEYSTDVCAGTPTGCTLCKAGTWSGSGPDWHACKPSECPAGQSNPNLGATTATSGCQCCDKGHFSSGGASQCEPMQCAHGAGPTKPACSAAPTDGCATCTIGQFSPGGATSCAPTCCSKGHTPTKAGATSCGDGCEECTDGHYSPGAAAKCESCSCAVNTMCVRGQAGAPNDCAICPAGTSSSGGDSTCEPND